MKYLSARFGLFVRCLPLAAALLLWVLPANDTPGRYLFSASLGHFNWSDADVPERMHYLSLEVQIWTNHLIAIRYDGFEHDTGSAGSSDRYSLFWTSLVACLAAAFSFFLLSLPAYHVVSGAEGWIPLQRFGRRIDPKNGAKQFESLWRDHRDILQNLEATKNAGKIRREHRTFARGLVTLTLATLYYRLKRLIRE